MNMERKNFENVGKVIINESTKRYIFEVHRKLLDVVEECISKEVNVDDASKVIAEILSSYPKRDSKDAIKMILENDLNDIDKKSHRVYAKMILKGGKELRKNALKKKKKSIKKIVKNSKKFQKVMNSPDRPHPFGVGFERLKKEIEFRPKFLMDDLSFKLFHRFN